MQPRIQAVVGTQHWARPYARTSQSPSHSIKHASPHCVASLRSLRCCTTAAIIAWVMAYGIGANGAHLAALPACQLFLAAATRTLPPHAAATHWRLTLNGLPPCATRCHVLPADVANAFATSVGSRTLKLKWAIAIAVVMETCGAIFLGGSVSSTISGGVCATTQAPDTCRRSSTCMRVLITHHALLLCMQPGVADPKTFANNPDIFAYGEAF